MSDIVERLIAPAYWISGSSEGHEGENDAPLEAADEITRLREELLRQNAKQSEEIIRLRAALRDVHAAAGSNHLIANIARAALGGGDD